MWKHLMVPHDFSPCAARALELAQSLAVLHGATVALVHVSALPPNLAPETLVLPPEGGTPVRIDTLTVEGARRELDALAAPLRRSGLDVRTVALATSSGDVAKELLRAADEQAASAIVLGTHGRTGLSHLLLGSIAEKVIQRARVPVVTVRSPAPEAVPTREESLAEDELAG
jgi:nucleotide-binding universal stress UspA family protein